MCLFYFTMLVFFLLVYHSLHWMSLIFIVSILFIAFLDFVLFFQFQNFPFLNSIGLCRLFDFYGSVFQFLQLFPILRRLKRYFECTKQRRRSEKRNVHNFKAIPSIAIANNSLCASKFSKWIFFRIFHHFSMLKYLKNCEQSPSGIGKIWKC